MNGTYINYMRVSGGVTLKHGDIVCFGHLNGANLKPGEDVAPFFSDLKYQVYLGNPNQTKDSTVPDSTPATVGKRQRQTSQSGSLGSPKAGDTGSPETKVSRSTKQKTTNSHKSRRLEPQDRKTEHDDEEAGDKSSSSEDDLLTAASKRKLPTSNLSSSIKQQKKSNGERQTKRHSVAPSSPPPSSHSKKSSSGGGGGGHQHHGTKERKSGRSTGTSSSSAAKRSKTENDAELDSGGELYHYDTEECSARPCKHPQDVSIDWIQCDKCSNWYHQVCLGLRASEANVDVYYCPYCKKN
ncbi:hypothetical protein AAHC03_019000 [Spirometra sp. Aus1]